MLTEAIITTGFTTTTLGIVAALTQLTLPEVTHGHTWETWTKELVAIFIKAALRLLGQTKAVVHADKRVCTAFSLWTTITHLSGVDTNAITTDFAVTTFRVHHTQRHANTIKRTTFIAGTLVVRNTLGLLDHTEAFLTDCAITKELDTLFIANTTHVHWHIWRHIGGHVRRHVQRIILAETRDARLPFGTALIRGALHSRRRTISCDTL